jgi:hypothetical protein
MTRALVLVALFASGCTSAYTSIKPARGGGFLVTRFDNDYWTTHGTLLRCTPLANGDLDCKEVDVAP